MTLTPVVSVTLAQQRYDTHAFDAVIELVALPGVGAARIQLPARANVSADVGDSAAVSAGLGGDPEPIVTGTIYAIRRRAGGTEVIIADAAAQLAALRPSFTYQRQGAREIIRALADAAGIETGRVDLDVPLASYVAHANRTAGEHIATLAALGGAGASIAGDGALNVEPLDERASVALRYGRDLLAFEESSWRGSTAEHVPIGSGPGNVDGPDALHQTVARIPDTAPAPGPDSVWVSTPVLRSSTTVRTAREALARRDIAFTRQVNATCLLSPQLRPGVVAEVHEVPDRVVSPFRVIWVRHVVRASGSITGIVATGTGAEASLASRARGIASSVAGAFS
jgi:hypothetical protein